MSWTRSVSTRKSSSDGKPYISEKARQRPVRVLPPDDRAEFEAGHLIPRPDPMHTDTGADFTQPTSRDEFSNENDSPTGTEDNVSTGYASSSFGAATPEHDSSF
jgi:hypothetical protein